MTFIILFVHFINVFRALYLTSTSMFQTILFCTFTSYCYSSPLSPLPTTQIGSSWHGQFLWKNKNGVRRSTKWHHFRSFFASVELKSILGSLAKQHQGIKVTETIKRHHRTENKREDIRKLKNWLHFEHKNIWRKISRQ